MDQVTFPINGNLLEDWMKKPKRPGTRNPIDLFMIDPIQSERILKQAVEEYKIIKNHLGTDDADIKNKITKTGLTHAAKTLWDGQYYNSNVRHKLESQQRAQWQVARNAGNRNAGNRYGRYFRVNFSTTADGRALSSQEKTAYIKQYKKIYSNYEVNVTNFNQGFPSEVMEESTFDVLTAM